MHHTAHVLTWTQDVRLPMLAAAALAVAWGLCGFILNRRAEAATKTLGEARFDYSGFGRSGLAASMYLLPLAVFLWFIARMAAPDHIDGWLQGVTLFIVTLGWAAIVYVPMRAALNLRRDRRRRRESGQEIVVSRADVRFSEEGRTITVPWEGVTDYYRTPYLAMSGGIPPPERGLMDMPVLFVVKSSQGTFDFTTGIGDWRLLTALIQQRATLAGGIWIGQPAPPSVQPVSVKSSKTKR